MRCFNHSEIRAVGLCKHCYKGLCHECASDLGFGLACRDLHEQQVTSVKAMVERATRLQTVNRSNKYLTPIFFLVLGSFFAGYDLYADLGFGYGLWIGGLFIAYGLYLAVIVHRTYSSAEA